MASPRALQNAERNQRARANAGLDPNRPIESKPRTSHVRKLSGLEWLFSKGKLSETEVESGKRYGLDYLKAQDNGVIIPSNFPRPDAGGGAGRTKVVPGSIDYATSVGQVAAIIERDEVDALFDNDARALLILLAICAHGMTPLEFSGGDRAAALEAQISLRAMLIVMGVHYRKRDRLTQAQLRRCA